MTRVLLYVIFIIHGYTFVLSAMPSSSINCTSFSREATLCFTKQNLDLKAAIKGLLMIGDFKASSYRYQCSRIRDFKKAEQCLFDLVKQCSETTAALFPRPKQVYKLLDRTCSKRLDFDCLDSVDDQSEEIEECIKDMYDINEEIALGADVKVARCLYAEAQVECEVDVVEKCDYCSAHVLKTQFRILYPNGCYPDEMTDDWY